MASVGEALVKSGLVTKEHLRLALERQVVFGGRIGTNIVELGILREEELARFLSSHLKVPSVSTSQMLSIDEETIACIDARLADKYKVVPFKKEKNRIHLAMLDPKSFQNIEELRFVTGSDIIPYIASELRLLYCLERYYGIKRDLRFVSILDKEEQSGPKKSKGAEPGEISKLKEAFASIRDREEIAGLLISESGRVARRTALFVLKGKEFTGWVSKDIDIKKFSLNSAVPSIFSEVVMRRAYYRGPLLQIPGNSDLIELLGGAPNDCLMEPVNIRDRVICLLYADNGNNGVLDANVTYIDKIAGMAALSFEILIIRKKLMEL